MSPVLRLQTCIYRSFRWVAHELQINSPCGEVNKTFLALDKFAICVCNLRYIYIFGFMYHHLDVSLLDRNAEKFANVDWRNDDRWKNWFTFECLYWQILSTTLFYFTKFERGISPEGLKSHLHYFKTRYKQGTHIKWIEEYY